MSVFRNTSSAWWTMLLITGYGIFLTLPSTWSGCVVGSDTLSHLVMSRHFVDQLWAGDWYPRWLYGMNAGLGSPVFEFYAPIPYYITALFRPLVSSDPEGWHQLGLSASLAVIASGFTAYAWLSRLAGRRAALIGAMLYMSAPYHLVVDLYRNFAFAELWGFVWMPLVMVFARASLVGGVGALAGLAVSYALLIMTHLPTTLLFSWVPLVYALWMAEPGNRAGAFLRVAGGMLLGIGLSAVYLLPAMTTQQYVRFDLMKIDFLYFANHFLFHAPKNDFPGLSDRLKYLGITSSMALIVSLVAWHLEHSYQKGIERHEPTFWLLIAGVAFFMQLYPSMPIWDSISVLQTVQFPWRFNVVVTLAAATVISCWVNSKNAISIRREPAMLTIVALLLLVNALPLITQYRFLATMPEFNNLSSLENKIKENIKDRDSQKYNHVLVLLEAAKISRHESFWPQWSSPIFFSGEPEDVQFMKELTSSRDKAYRVKGNGVVRVQRWEPPLIELEVKADTSLSVQLLQFYYPGWVARLDGGPMRLEVGPSRPDGLLEVEVPPGGHRIVIKREPLPEERAGQLISGASLALLGALAVLWRIRSGSET